MIGKNLKIFIELSHNFDFYHENYKNVIIILLYWRRAIE